MKKPTVYIASPYSKGDPAINAHFQCKIFDQLFSDGKVLPVAPLWSHFQHILFPRPYQDWIDYDQSMLALYDICLRLNAGLPDVQYLECESKGADAEVETFIKMGKPVFYSIEDLYCWLEEKAPRYSVWVGYPSNTNIFWRRIRVDSSIYRNTFYEVNWLYNA